MPLPPNPPTLDPHERRFIVGSIAAVVVLGMALAGVAWANRPLSTTSTAPALRSQAAGDPLLTAVPQLEDALQGPLTSNAADPSIGPHDAAVTITIFSDFTCWYCGETTQAALAVQQRHPDTVRVIHKDFPESNKAYASYQAAIAARCAQKQGLFWEMAHKLYEHYDQLTKERITALGSDINDLEQAPFTECRAGRTNQPVTELIDDNIAEANALQLSGVPVLYLNDKAIFGHMSAEELEAAVTILTR